ncbi:MAG: hydrogenase iron-sulfur subunit [Caldilineae bacterium]|nr:MAG: hydrogenase iron-sulfur subunit [Caldilineae bacterium]
MKASRQRSIYAARRPLRKLEALWTTLERTVDRLSTIVVNLRPYNPLYHLGPLTITLLIFLALTGVYLTLLYRPGETRAYGSVQALSGNPLGSLIRSSHRYAGDVLLLVALLHALKIFLSDRFWGSRWLAWVSGWGMVIVFWFVGVLGYFLVWDEAALWLTQFMMDRLGGSFSLAFLGPESAARTFSFFVIVLFLHVFIPITLILGILLHLLRLARARYWAPRWLNIATPAMLLFIALLFPVASGEPADFARLIGRVRIDWLYLGFLPVTEQMGNVLFWGFNLVILAVVMAMPWLLKGQHLGPAKVIAANCTGCALCAKECPYEAIDMVHRDDESPFHSLAVVKPHLCTGCGVCVAACNDVAIELEGLHSAVVRQDLRRSVQQAAETPTLVYTCDRHEALGTLPALQEERVVEAGLTLRAAGSRHGAGLPPRVRAGTWPDASGRPRPVMTAVVPCMGMLHPNWAVETIQAGASATIMVTCPADDCAYREGPYWVRHRMNRKRTLRSGLAHHLELAPGSRRELLDLWNRLLTDTEGVMQKAPTAISLQRRDAGSPLPWLGRARSLLPGLILLLLVVLVSLLPHQPAGSEPAESQVRIVLNHSGKHLASAENLPPEIQAKIPANVDPATVLGGERFPVGLRLEIDGRMVFEHEYAPGGVRREGASQAAEKVELTPGGHELQIWLRDDGGEWRAVFAERILARPGEAINLYYDGEHDRFLRRE